MIRRQDEFEDKEFLSDLDRRLRTCAPERRPSDVHRLQLKMMLDHNFKFHRARLTVLSTLIAAVILLGTLRLADVGSDAFDLRPADTQIDDRPAAVAPFSNFRIMHPDADLLLSADDLAELENIFETQLSGQCTILNVRGWTIMGHTMFFVEYETQIADKAVRYNYIPSFIDGEMARTFFQFFESDRDPFLNRVQSGEATVVGRAVAVVSGKEIQFVQYSGSHPQWGEIVYWLGEPLRHSDSETPSMSK